MKKLTLALLPCLFIIFCISCYKNEVPQIDSKKENKQINTYSGFRTYEPMSKEDYLDLSISDKKEAWVAKLNYILTDANITSSQETVVEDLIDEIEALEGGEFSEGLDDAADALISKFSETDLINTFASLDANTLSGTNTPNCTTCSVTGGSITGSTTLALDDCNCDWTCGDPLASSSCVNPDCCEPTTTGCGLLWAFPCDGLDVL